MIILTNFSFQLFKVIFCTFPMKNKQNGELSDTQILSVRPEKIALSISSFFEIVPIQWRYNEVENFGFGPVLHSLTSPEKFMKNYPPSINDFNFKFNAPSTIIYNKSLTSLILLQFFLDLNTVATARVFGSAWPFSRC